MHSCSQIFEVIAFFLLQTDKQTVNVQENNDRNEKTLLMVAAKMESRTGDC